MAQNTSHAVMAQRHEPADSLDMFPTPPWATRALCEHVLALYGWNRDALIHQTVWEPACGRGDMVRPLREYFGQVLATDIHDYGGGQDGICDFMDGWDRSFNSYDWIITNPPFKLAANFIKISLRDADIGVCMLVRTSFIEGVERYEKLFSKHPPSVLAPFAERVPMFRGRLNPKGSSATAYCWLVWFKDEQDEPCEVRWIPPCRRALERPGDYPEGAP